MRSPRAPPTVIDVREASEWEQGHLPGAVHISKSYVEQQVEAAAPDRDAEVILYCAGGVRSLFAAQTLEQLGYTNVASMSGGFQAWKSAGLPWEAPVILSPEQKQRYSRHLLIPEVGAAGQTRLLESKALLIGAGGLGSPAALYLAAAGVGTIGIVDFDVVDLSNLQRQILHTNDRIGERKVESARKTLEALNPDVKVVTHEEMLVADNVDRIITGYDVIIDGTDTFETRYLLNDAAVAKGITVIHAVGVPLRGPADDLRPVRGSVLPLPLPDAAAARARARLLRRRRPGRRARDHGHAPGKRGAQGAAGNRRHARRPAAALRRPRLDLHRAQASARSGLPGLLHRGHRGPSRRQAAADPVVRGRRRGRVERRAVRPRRPGVSIVRIPSVLRAAAGGNKELELAGASVGDVVNGLVTEYPSLRGQLLTDDGELNRFVNVYVNGQDVRYLDGLATPVGERDEVRLLPAMAGG